MTAGVLAAGLAAMLVYGLVQSPPPTPWARRRAARERADLAAWARYRAAFYAAGERTPTPPRPPRVRSARRGPRFYLVRDPIE